MDNSWVAERPGAVRRSGRCVAPPTCSSASRRPAAVPSSVPGGGSGGDSSPPEIRPPDPPKSVSRRPVMHGFPPVQRQPPRSCRSAGATTLCTSHSGPPFVHVCPVMRPPGPTCPRRNLRPALGGVNVLPQVGIAHNAARDRALTGCGQSGPAAASTGQFAGAHHPSRRRASAGAQAGTAVADHIGG